MRRRGVVTMVVVLKLVARCRWNCGLDKLSTILDMKTLHRQPTVHGEKEWTNLRLDFRYIMAIRPLI
jgi:hypothetical protein